MNTAKALIAFLSILTAPMAYAQDISDYQWKNRLVVLVDETLGTKAMRSQLNLLQTDTAGLAERDIVLLQLTPKSVILASGETPGFTSTETYRSLSIPKDFKGVLLIGKDGGVKLRQPFEVERETIFTLIDGMPMRRSELKRDQGQ